MFDMTTNYRDNAHQFTFTASELIGMMSSGDAPGSRYGLRPSSWQPVAAEYLAIVLECAGEVTPEMIEILLSQVVNDSDEVALRLREADSDLFDNEWTKHTDTFVCSSCGTHGTSDDGCEEGEPCPNEYDEDAPCDGTCSVVAS